MAIDIIPEKGGQCSFYCRFPLKSRFLKDLDTKKQVVFDTTYYYQEVGIMKEINLGRILVENRHKRGITQDELAAYMGVSKAAVSKWETGGSLR